MIGNPSSFGPDYYARFYRGGYWRRNPRRKHRRYLRELQRWKHSGRLLDVGASFGAFAREARVAFEVHALDPSEEVLREAEREAPGIHLHRGGLIETGFDFAFDAVTCFDVLEHIGSLPTAFERLASLLAPGGVLCLAVPVYDGPLGALANRLDRDTTHVHRRSRAWWIAQCERHGFVVVDRAGLFRYLLGPVYLNAFSRPLWRVSPALWLMARVPPAASGGFAASATSR